MIGKSKTVIRLTLQGLEISAAPWATWLIKGLSTSHDSNEKLYCY